MKYTILVIDDDFAWLRFMRLFLSRANHDIIPAHNGQLGIQQAKSQKPDLIVLDIMMPNMNGIEVCQVAFESIPIQLTFPSLLLQVANLMTSK